MVEDEGGTRREQRRAQTFEEIRQHALAQVAHGGPEAVSLNAIARTMRMSGPALYRYFASREDLLVALVADSYGDLAGTVEAAAGGAASSSGREGRLRAVAAAYRGWAVTHPHRYRLAFSSSYGSGLLAPDQVLPAANRTMAALLAAVAELGQPRTAGTHVPPRSSLADQLARWQKSQVEAGVLDASVLHLGVVAWTRLHGLVSLEIEGVFASMGLDPGLLFDAEIDQIVASASLSAASVGSERRPRPSRRGRA